MPLAIATSFGVALLPNRSHGISWRGNFYPLQFGSVTLRLVSQSEICGWSASVGFSAPPIPYPLLGLAGCLECFDATFLGEEQRVELVPNASFPGTVLAQP